MILQQVSVVIPTLNSMRLLQPVLPEMRSWLEEVGEVIVVDSHSTDGTMERLREALDFPHVRFLTHPPGLYASWNFGIGQATRKWVHIATAGDALRREDLVHLVRTAEENDADVVVAPPVFVDEEGQALPDPNWPVLQLLEAHPGQDELVLSGEELAYFALFHCHPPFRYDCWMGSSASNLYRTSVLQVNPFPTHARHFGDTLFGLENARNLKAVFSRRRCGRFVVHHRTDLQAPEDRQWLFEVFEPVWRKVLTGIQGTLAAAPGTARLIEHLLADAVRSAQLVEQVRDKLWAETDKRRRLQSQLSEFKTKRDERKRPSLASWLKLSN
ncbi:MAG: glycosyltransferase [Verrucomicrobia bacterium]|nr:glycosyltransferase [Verrucomicrobiota bacterium]